MRSGRLAIVLLAAWLLCACGGTAPQRPSQRKSEAPPVDSAQMALLEMNMQLTKAADEQVMQLAMAQEEPYALYEASTWMHIIEQGDERKQPPRMGESCAVHMRTYTLDGKLLEDTEGTSVIGKNELPKAVEWNISELHPGARVRMYVPWYAAYGLQGTAHVPPYENVIIELELK